MINGHFTCTQRPAEEPEVAFQPRPLPRSTSPPAVVPRFRASISWQSQTPQHTLLRVVNPACLPPPPMIRFQPGPTGGGESKAKPVGILFVSGVHIVALVRRTEGRTSSVPSGGVSASVCSLPAKREGKIESAKCQAVRFQFLSFTQCIHPPQAAHRPASAAAAAHYACSRIRRCPRSRWLLGVNIYRLFIAASHARWPASAPQSASRCYIPRGQRWMPAPIQPVVCSGASITPPTGTGRRQSSPQHTR